MPRLRAVEQLLNKLLEYLLLLTCPRYSVLYYTKKKSMVTLNPTGWPCLSSFDVDCIGACSGMNQPGLHDSHLHTQHCHQNKIRHPNPPQKQVISSMDCRGRQTSGLQTQKLRYMLWSSHVLWVSKCRIATLNCCPNTMPTPSRVSQDVSGTSMRLLGMTQGYRKLMNLWRCRQSWRDNLRTLRCLSADLICTGMNT